MIPNYLEDDFDPIQPYHIGSEKKFNGREAILQAKAVKYLRRMPDYPLVFHAANERQTSSYHGQKLRAAGQLAGIPDILIPDARAGYFGAAIELKTMGNKVSPHQEIVLDHFARKNWICVVIWNCQGVKDFVHWYWKENLPTAKPGQRSTIPNWPRKPLRSK